MKYFYWLIKCIKNAPLYPKMQRIEKGKKNENSQTSANKIKF